MLGLDLDLEGRLWEIEMGPMGGDELNLIRWATSYGYPEFQAPAASWNPVISPADLMIYKGDLFPEWRGDALIAGLPSKAIVHCELDGEQAREIARYDMGARIRSLTEGPDGAIWVLEDDEDDSTGRLLKITPAD